MITSKMTADEFKFRNRVIYHCCETGEFTYKALGELFNISGSRIKQIHCKGIRLQKQRERRDQRVLSEPILLQKQRERRDQRDQLSHSFLNDLGFLNYPIDHLDISMRTYRMVNELKLTCVGDVLNTEDATFLSHRNFGRRSLNELKMAVQEVAKKYKAAIAVAI